MPHFLTLRGLPAGLQAVACACLCPTLYRSGLNVTGVGAYISVVSTLPIKLTGPTYSAPVLTSCLYLQAAVLNAKGKNPDGIPRPSVMAFSRQGMPNQPGTSKEGVMKGLYTVHGGDEKPDVILIASGELATSAAFGLPLLMSMPRRSRSRLILNCRHASCRSTCATGAVKTMGGCNGVQRTLVLKAGVPARGALPLQAPSCAWRSTLPRRLRPQGRRRAWCQQCAGSSLRTRTRPTRTASCLQMLPPGWAIHHPLECHASAGPFSATSTSLGGFPSLCMQRLHTPRTPQQPQQVVKPGWRSERRVLWRRCLWRPAAPLGGRGTWAPRASPLAWTALEPPPLAPPSTRSLASPRRQPWLLPSR